MHLYYKDIFTYIHIYRCILIACLHVIYIYTYIHTHTSRLKALDASTVFGIDVFILHCKAIREAVGVSL